MRAGIFPRRDLVEVYGASCTYNDAGAPLPGALFGTGRKEEKTRLSLPPRLVGANEGGTDRPVYALPLSGSCRASTPKCTLHRSRCSAVSLSFSCCPSASLYPSYLVLRNFVEREAGTLCPSDGKKRDQPGTGARRTSSLFLFISDARNIYRCALL